ncbi:pyridoxamine 5'-phosphate oxidase family protein [Streptomyces sp. RS10V-4]|uniref:helix-turn-helix domain-containing protein n=1 Tax=Streptomyces rhizoryzae TaxID=2932493 RepID=UPI002003F78D|nr:pyridoxamine 5'-phosphate oxidase family protein [Streptomyces rhizoryzae]MCK7622227.1 pyridoxamine 5'-phosphate oxidase family protein [Streptomyces rhizoryzae]
MTTDKPAGTGGGPAPFRGDLGRRAALRRQQLGLTREEVAARAAASPGYLQYIEEHPAQPDIGFLLRLAGALDTTVADLVGGTADLPAGLGVATVRPEVLVLGPGECRELLGSHGVGRVAVTVDGVPAVFPVNYTVDHDVIAYRTHAGSGPAAAAGHEAALEVDHLDEAFSQGWSVLAVGPAEIVTAFDRTRRLEENAYSAPWVGGGRYQWIAVRPTRLSGRRIRVAGAPGSPAGGAGR